MPTVLQLRLSGWLGVGFKRPARVLSVSEVLFGLRRRNKTPTMSSRCVPEVRTMRHACLSVIRARPSTPCDWISVSKRALLAQRGLRRQTGRQSAFLGSNRFPGVLFYYILSICYILYCPVWYNKFHINPTLIGGSTGVA